MLPLQASSIELRGPDVQQHPIGDLAARVRAHLRGEGPGGLVVLGPFGSGKTSLCAAVAAEPEPGALPVSLVPLALVGRAGTVEEGLRRTVGATRLAEAREGARVLLLDGLDEVLDPGRGGFRAFFDDLRARVGPRWLLTSRPSHVRTEADGDVDQADSLAADQVSTVLIEPLSPDVVASVLGAHPRSLALLRSVENLADLAASPLLLQIIPAALPHIEPGRPIDAWGLLDAWLRGNLRTGPDHDDALLRLEALTWDAFRASGYSPEALSFAPDALAAARLPSLLRRALMVTDLDGRVRFGHRSVFEFFLAAHIAPRLGSNQGHGPDALSGLRITDATRTFLVGRTPPMPVRIVGERALIPRGNFVAGGASSSQERPLRIQHLAEPVWVSRVPVTHADWRAFLDAHPDPRTDAWYLRHWSHDRAMPEGMEEAPIFHLWPEDADAYAQWRGARLPSADEWEKAARGIDGRRWPWGDHWRRGLAVTAELGVERPLPGRAFGAHGEAQLFSAAGGVFEYTASSWRDMPDRGRVVMGGCYTHNAHTSRLSLRLSHRLSGNLKTGLRLAWSAP